MRLRAAVRAIVLDPDDRILLCRFRFDEPDGEVIVWATPGGGIEAGEDNQTALRRELDEEIGLALDQDPPHVWHREMIADHIAGYDGVIEDFYVVRTQAFEPRGSLTDEQLVGEGVSGFEWWTQPELAAYAGPGLFAPRTLPSLVAAIVANGVPKTPIELIQL
jgi:8-oxo-dGTP diphosphatase